VQGDWLKALLGRGYFPKELPRGFTTADFGTHAADILADWEASKVFERTKPKSKVDGRVKNGSYGYKLPECSLETISAPKRGYERRNLHITHPIPQALLCAEIAQYWKAIQKYLPQDSRSIDRLKIDSSLRRGLSEIDFKLHRVKKAYIEAQSDWIVKTDISRYYPSIYTHSIAWACYGKEQVKANRKAYECSLADRLDALVRASNRNQTIGIPVGPETSRIIAEMIGRRIDREVCSRVPKLDPIWMDRLQDDWFVGVPDLPTAQLVLSSITLAYREFGLEINGSKTSLTEIERHTEDRDIAEIAGFLGHSRAPLSGYRLRELLNLACRIQADNPHSSGLTYVLAVLEGLSFDGDDVEHIESFLLRAAVLAPRSLEQICAILLNLNFKSRNISKRRIGYRFKQLANRAVDLGHTYELMWLLWTLRGLRIKISSPKISDYVSDGTHAALSIVLMDMRNMGVFVSPLPEEKWLADLDEDKCKTDGIWLLAYEGFRHGWLPDRTGLMQKPFFGPMARREVVFYNPRANVELSARRVNRRRQENRRSFRTFAQFLMQTNFSQSRY